MQQLGLVLTLGSFRSFKSDNLVADGVQLGDGRRSGICQVKTPAQNATQISPSDVV